MKGVPFINRRYTKGVPFLLKLVIEGRGGPWDGASPYKTLLSTPLTFPQRCVTSKTRLRGRLCADGWARSLKPFNLYQKTLFFNPFFSSLGTKSMSRGVGETPHERGVGMLVGNFELNPKGDRSGSGPSFF